MQSIDLQNLISIAERMTDHLPIVPIKPILDAQSFVKEHIDLLDKQNDQIRNLMNMIESVDFIYCEGSSSQYAFVDFNDLIKVKKALIEVQLSDLNSNLLRLENESKTDSSQNTFVDSAIRYFTRRIKEINEEKMILLKNFVDNT